MKPKDRQKAEMQKISMGGYPTAMDPQMQPLSRLEMPIKEDTLGSLDMITAITMLLHRSKELGYEIAHKQIKVDVFTPKEIKDKMEATY